MFMHVKQTILLRDRKVTKYQCIVSQKIKQKIKTGLKLYVMVI